MTLDEAIKHTEEIAEEYQRVVDTGIVFDDVTIDMMYCDDTEVIEEHLANYQKRAEEHRQLTEWLKDYKRLLKQEPKTGHWIINEDEENTVHGHCSVCGWEAHYYEDDIIGMPYCPSCGARMVELQESEET